MEAYLKQIEPCPARGSFHERLMTAPGWWAEEKYDGDRRLAHFSDSVVRFTGRRIAKESGLFVEKTLNVPHLAASSDVVCQLHGTILDGEVYFPGGRSKDVTAIMGSKPERALALQKERGFLSYVVFDILFYRGSDLRGYTLQERRKYLESVVSAWKNPDVKLSTVELNNRESFLQEIWARGGEGIILKHTGASYGDKRSWVKVKKEFTEDCVIIGFESPKETSQKKNGEVSVTRLAANGWIGAITLGQYKNGELVKVGSCSGMPDDLRADMSKNGPKYVNQVVEVLANEREPTGAFRHPRFVRIRDDKNATDCVWSTS